MKKGFIVILCLICSALILNAQDEVRLTILHTNDFHSHLQGFAPESAYTPDTIDGDPTVGGFSRIAGIISEVRSENPNSTLVLDAGDCLMGTLFHTMEITTGFQLPLMKRAGYDVVAIGNHDFDYGPDAFADIVTSSVARGEIPVLLLGNVITDPDDPADDKFEEQMSNGSISRYTVTEKNGVKIGIFSLLGKDADDSAPYAPPVKFDKIVPVAKKLTRMLRKEGCQVIICLSHSGIVKDKKGKWAGEDVKLAKKVKGIDLIISGHTHTVLEEPLLVRSVPIVQAGTAGRYVGKVELVISDGKARLDKSSLIAVNDAIRADKDIQSAIDAQEQMINSTILAPLELSYTEPVARAQFNLTCDLYGDVASSNLGVLVADAIYYYMNHQGPGTDIAVVAAGVIRDPIMPGTQSVADIFRVISLGSGSDNVPGYPLSRLFITGRELKNVIEVFTMSAKSNPSHFGFYSHLLIDIDPKGGIFNKVKGLSLKTRNGDVVAVSTDKKDNHLYSIVANSYMLDFLGIIKKKSFGLINVVPKDENGNPVADMDMAVVDFDQSIPGIQEGKEWLALVKYLQQMKSEKEDSIPYIPQYYNALFGGLPGGKIITNNK